MPGRICVVRFDLSEAGPGIERSESVDEIHEVGIRNKSHS